jgi:hypothetical protein
MSASRGSGCRYRILAARCRNSAAKTNDIPGKTGLLRMAWLYDLKAVEAECKAMSVRVDVTKASTTQVRWRLAADSSAPTVRNNDALATAPQRKLETIST